MIQKTSPRKALLHAVNRSSFEMWNQLDVQILEKEGLVQIYSGIVSPFFNRIALTGNSKKTVYRIYEMIAFFRKMNVPYSMMNLQDVEPEGFTEILEPLGLLPVAIFEGMAINLKKYKPLPVTDDISIELLSKSEPFDAWQAILQEGMQFSEDATKKFTYLHKNHLEKANPRFCHYIAKESNAALACVSLLSSEKAVGIYNVCTLPAARGRGIASMLLSHVLHQASSSFSHAVLLSTPMGVRMYRKLGFTTYSLFNLYFSKEQRFTNII